MKRFLLTWYGITDLKSAMGFDFQGPILGALKSGSFDDVYILAYTKKSFYTDEEVSQQKQAIVDLNHYQEDKRPLPDEIFFYLDTLANTPAGHEYYYKWLNNQINELGLPVNITIHECLLSELNDTAGIYFSAVEALKKATLDMSSEITFFLSPGTPVMAFSWALVMLAFPDHNIKLLASPDSRKGIQLIDIPNAVLTHISRGREEAEK